MWSSSGQDWQCVRVWLCYWRGTGVQTILTCIAVHDVCIHLCLGSLIIIHLFMMLPCGTHFLTTSKQLPQCTLQKNSKEPIIISYTFLLPFKEQHSFFVTHASMPSFNYFSLLNFSVILFHFCLSILWNSLPVSVTLCPVLAYLSPPFFVYCNIVCSCCFVYIFTI